jgi:RNA polymerase sigma factor (sigma-70 family)
MATATLLQHIRYLATADHQTDRDLLRRFTRDRDGQAFAALLRRHGPMVWRACCRLLPCASDAEDVLQATFLLLARKAGALCDRDSVAGWLYGVAHRLALRTRCANARRSAVEGRTPTRSSPDPLAEISLREAQQLFDEALAALPETERTVLVLCCLDGFTQDEAARQLGCSHSTLKRRLSEARVRLRRHLLRRGLTLSGALVAAAIGPVAEAMPPAALVTAVLRAVAGGPVPERVAALAAHGVGGLLMARLGATAATVLILIAAVVGIGTAALMPAEPSDNGPDPVVTLDEPRPDEKPRTRADRFGDPLPDEAITRIGTLRFRSGDYINAIAFGADGKQLLSCGNDGVRIWDAATGRQQRHLVSAPGTRFLSAGFSPDGKLAGTTSVSETGELTPGPFAIWDTATGKKIQDLGEAIYWSVCFAPERGIVAASRHDQVVETWDLHTGKQLASWSAHAARNSAPFVTFTAGGKTLVSSGADHTICFWEPTTGKKLRSLGGVVNTIHSLALSDDGKLLASVEIKESPPNVVGGETPQARVRILDTADGKVVRQVEAPAAKLRPGQVNGVRHVALSPNGKTLAGVGSESAVYLWDVATGKLSSRIAAFAPSALSFSADGGTLAVATWGHAVQLYDVSSGKELPRGEGLPQPAWFLGLTRDGKTLAAPDGGSTITLWDTATGELRRRLHGHERFVTGAILAADGRALFSAGADFTLRRWDLATGEARWHTKLGPQAAYLGGAGALACSPDGKRLVVKLAVTNGTVLRLVDGETGQTLDDIRPADDAVVHGAAFLPDGRSLVVWTGDRKARVWDVTTGKVVRDVEYTEAVRVRRGPVAIPGSSDFAMFAATVSPDGRLIAFASDHDLIAVHDLEFGREWCRVEKLPHGVGCLAFSPDGRTLAWGNGVDPVVHLLEIATGKERHAFTGHRGGVVSLTFSADGNTLISGGNDTTLLVWDLRGHAGALSADDVRARWADLRAEDAPRGYRAVRQLANAPASAVGLLREHLKPIEPADAKVVAALIAALDSDDFSLRQKAGAELEQMGDLCADACRRALAARPALEVRRRLEALLDRQATAARHPSMARLRLSRAMEVLELAGTEDAQQLLTTLAAGARGASATEEARASLTRLVQRNQKN